MASNGTVNIIRKIEVIEAAGHHGGAWKVAYADFMTAMMAFFLLMWILSSADEQKLKGIAEYFTSATMPGGSGVLDGATLGPPGTLSASNGATVARGAEEGKIDDETPSLWEVKDATPTSDPVEKVKGTNIGRFENPAGGGGASAGEKDKKLGKEDADTEFAGSGIDPVKASQAQDEKRFEELETEILQAMQEVQDLRPLKKNVVFEHTPEGLRIQIVDQDGQPMFINGKSQLTSAASMLIKQLGYSLSKLPNDVLISGHTDSVPFADSSNFDNWDLSSERANALRRLLVGYGTERSRITKVSGLADTEPLYEDRPDDPANRRISVLLAYQKPSVQASPEPVEIKKAARPSLEHVVPEPVVENQRVLQKAEIDPPETHGAINLNGQVFNNLRSALQ